MATIPVHEKSKKSVIVPDNILFLNDSKYEELRKIILKAKDEDGNGFKVIIFCIFRKTIEYLCKRINSEFGPNTADAVYGVITDVNVRYKIIMKFKSKINQIFLFVVRF